MGKLFLILSVTLVIAASIVAIPLLAESNNSTTKESSQTDEISIAKAMNEGQSNFGRYIGAGLAIAGATIGAGIGVARVGAAAIGVISEKQEMTGISFVFIALAEGICLWGFIIAIMILNA